MFHWNSISDDAGYKDQSHTEASFEIMIVHESENHIWFMSSYQLYVQNVRCLNPPSLTREQLDYVYTPDLCSERRLDHLLHKDQGSWLVLQHVQATTGKKKSTSKIFKFPSPCFSLALCSLLHSVRATPSVFFICKNSSLCNGEKRYRSKNSDGQSWYHDQYVPGKKRLDYAEGTM